MKNFAKRISALVLAVVVSAAVLCPAAFAAQLPSLPKDQCVVDGAGVLSSSTVQTITELNAQLESSCSGAQIGVLTVEYTGNDSTEDYATQAFNAWGIGSSSNNNGVLILLVMESAQYADGDYYLTYGDGFRNTTLAKQSSAIAQTMEDQFAAKDYDGAVTTCARNVANTIADIYGVSLSGSTGNGSTVQPGYQGGQSSGGSTLTDILTLVVSVVLLIVIIRSMAYIFASPCGWLWCFGGPRPPRRRRGPPPPPPGGFYGGFGGMGGGSFGGGAGRGGFGPHEQGERDRHKREQGEPAPQFDAPQLVEGHQSEEDEQPNDPVNRIGCLIEDAHEVSFRRASACFASGDAACGAFLREPICLESSKCPNCDISQNAMICEGHFEGEKRGDSKDGDQA